MQLQDFARVSLIRFIVQFLLSLTCIIVVIHFILGRELIVLSVDVLSLVILFYTYYLVQVKKQCEKAAWIVSLLIGAFLCVTFFLSEGTRGISALLLIFPLISFPLLGIRKATYLYIVYSILLLSITYYGVINWPAFRSSFAYFANTFFALIMGGMIIFHTEKVMQEVTKALRISSETDELTGLWNRKKSDQIIEQLSNGEGRSNKTYSIILLDVDFFKEINDQYGHQVGDAVLIDLSMIIKGTLTVVDAACRWGGEEFLIILPDAGLSEAEAVTKELLSRIRLHQFTEMGYSITASAGVSEYDTGSKLSVFFQKVDNALYQAKDEGRDKYIVAH